MPAHGWPNRGIPASPPYNGFSHEKPCLQPLTHSSKRIRVVFLTSLKEFIRIPSISTLPKHAPDIERAASFVAESLRKAGLENVEIIQTGKHPLVFADWLHAPGKPTVLCYGHYDVQPADPLELWVSPPFEPTFGKLFGAPRYPSRRRRLCPTGRQSRFAGFPRERWPSPGRQKGRELTA